MVTKRNIPVELRRQVLVESGHRCAIPTCRQTQIEIHHIEPWEKCLSHEFSNLIALCPNCHTRAHNKEIDAKALHTYKKILLKSYDDAPSVDHGTVSEGEVVLRPSDGKIHHLVVAGDITIKVEGWEKSVDSLILKISDADKYTITWHGFAKLPFANDSEFFSFKEGITVIIEIANYDGFVAFNVIHGGEMNTYEEDCE